MKRCEVVVLNNPQHLCGNEVTGRMYIKGKVLNVCSHCVQLHEGVEIPDTNWTEMLKGVLGGDYGGPSIGFEDGCFMLYVAGDDPMAFEIMCHHEKWEVFMTLCAEFSDYVPGEENDSSV